jgi:hypothetical protein
MSRSPAAVVLNGFDGGGYGSATFMAEHHDQPGVDFDGSELDTAQCHVIHALRARTDDEEVAEPAVEDQLGRYPGVDTGEHDGER